VGSVDYRLLERFVAAQQENAFRRLLATPFGGRHASPARRRPRARPVA
jgi:hypothetical protein